MSVTSKVAVTPTPSVTITSVCTIDNPSLPVLSSSLMIPLAVASLMGTKGLVVLFKVTV